MHNQHQPSNDTPSLNQESFSITDLMLLTAMVAGATGIIKSSADTMERTPKWGELLEVRNLSIKEIIKSRGARGVASSTSIYNRYVFDDHCGRPMTFVVGPVSVSRGQETSNFSNPKYNANLMRIKNGDVIRVKRANGNPWGPARIEGEVYRRKSRGTRS